MKDPARPSKPGYGSGYDQKRGDHFGKRDSHGGYVSNKSPAKEDSSYNQAHGEGKQVERTNPKADKPNAT